jgi:hypothetical protein
MSLDKLVRFSWTDDSGNGLDGTIINNTQLQKIFDAVDGSIGQSVKVLGGAYTSIPTDDFLKVTGGSFIIYAYNPSGYDGRQLDIANVGTGTTTVAGIGGQSIGGDASWPLPPKTSLRLKSDGANWIITSLTANSVVRQELTLTSGSFRPWPSAPCGPHEDINAAPGYFTLGLPFAPSVDSYAYTQFTLPKALQKSVQMTMQIYFTGKTGGPDKGVFWTTAQMSTAHGESLAAAPKAAASVLANTTNDLCLSIAAETAIAGNWVRNNDLIRIYVGRLSGSQAGDAKAAHAYLIAMKLRVWMEAPHDE